MKENNRLIAEFMGYIDNGDSEFLIHPETNYDHSVNDKDWFLYNSSWDWLMLVLKKIDDLEYELPEDSNLIGDITHGLVSIDIAITFEAVIEFIKWYNENKYPFKEGDDYWTIENGKPIWSCWDHISEEIYDENPIQRYFSSKEEVKEFIENSKNMIRTEILCPECMKKKLLRKKAEEKDLRCDECGTEFIEIAPNIVKYK